MKLNFRQGIVSCQQVGPQPDFLVLSSTAGFVDLKVAPTPLIVALAHGGADYLLKFDATIPQAWGPLTEGVVNYLFIDVDLITGAINRGITIREPVVSSQEPPAALGQHWFDLANTTMKVRTPDNAKWRTVARLFVGRVIGTSQLVVNTIGTTVALNVSCDPGYLLFDEGMRPLRTSAGELLTSSTPVRVHSTVGTSGVLTNSINNFIPVRAAEPIPAMSLVYFSGIDSVSLASSDPALTVQKNPIGLIELPLGVNEVGVITQTGEITYDGWDWSNDIGKPLYCGFHGELTTTRPVSIQAYRVGFVKNARTILFYVDAETIPQVVAQAGSLISGEPPILAVTGTNAHGEIVTTITLPPASGTQHGYLSASLYTTLASLDPRITAAETNITTLQTSKSNVGHSHAIADTSGLQLTLDGKALLNHAHPEYAPVIHSHPEYSLTTHVHDISGVTGLQLALDGKAGIVHTHAISGVTGLQTALDGKADTTHAHIVADVTGLQSLLDGKAASVHGHLISDVSNLQTALDGKASVSHTQTAATITDFSEAVDDRVAALLVAGSNITLTYNDAGNALTIASTGGSGGGISTIQANLVFDPITFLPVYETFTPTMLTMFGNSNSGQPRIKVSDLGGGEAQVELVNTGVNVNTGVWAGGESGFINSSTVSGPDLHYLSFDRHIAFQYTSLGDSTFGNGKRTVIISPQLLNIKSTTTTVSTYPRAFTSAPNEQNVSNSLVFSSAFTVVQSGTLNEITTIDLASAGSAVVIKNANGDAITTGATSITVGAGLDVSNITPTEVIVTARCPSVPLSM